jgi:GT2 family glycosyltransferase
MPLPSYAVVICTRNRAADLAATLPSVAAQRPAPPLVLVMDASDAGEAARTKAAVAAHAGPSGRYVAYAGAVPSLARQRNAALDALPPSVEVVFFLDDDVTLQPGYFAAQRRYLAAHPGVGGIGGLEVLPSGAPVPAARTSWARQLLRYAFLIDHPQPGRVLPSGFASSPHRAPHATAPFEVDWLCGFSCGYRRTWLDRERFDERLEGYSHFEDRDLSLRLRPHTRLVVHPGARLVHRTSPVNRHDAARYATSGVTHLAWLVRKHAALRRAAFWWAMAGSRLALLTTRHPARDEVLRGWQRGLRAVWRDEHPLLEG